ncbi:AraC family transcriptional regulator [uncultured Tateyamaria sp.]|uniref:helix-turn-helix domain-containing protein n=1 Tax=uncultured Tateyamaria sp. TaxID=455651 RepID=UPI002621A5BB|nr:AraC family transcriptional regulator [uncultured Tateyamaria sp.]
MSKALAVSHGEFGRAALYDLDRPITTHAHREGHLIFRIGGEIPRVRVRNEAISCCDGVAAAVSPWAPHSFSIPGGSCLSLVLYIKPMWFLENTGSADFALDFGAAKLHLTDEIKSMVNRLTSLMLVDEGEFCAQQVLIDLTASCYALSWRYSKQNNLLAMRRRFSDFRIRRSQKMMTEYLSDHEGLDRLSSEVGLSRPHFFKLFKKQTGVTPNIYFNTLRSEQAIEELVYTDKSVTEIGHDLGFASQASFTRFFTHNVGIAPTEYKRVAHQ